MRSSLLLLLSIACTPPATEAVWALDPMYVEPSGEGIRGFQSWELFAAGWERHYAPRYYVCGVVVALAGTPVEPAPSCPGCGPAWQVTTSLVESDCDADTATDAAYLTLRGLAFGDDPEDPTVGPPHPGRTTGAWADYGDGFVSYGWAYPEALDHGGEGPSAWDGSAAYTFVPVYVWDL